MGWARSQIIRPLENLALYKSFNPFWLIPKDGILGHFSLTKDPSLLLHAIHIPFYWRILKKTILFSGFINPFKKICETRKLEFIHE
jgi:hypothetical protein